MDLKDLVRPSKQTPMRKRLTVHQITTIKISDSFLNQRKHYRSSILAQRHVPLSIRRPRHLGCSVIGATLIQMTANIQRKILGKVRLKISQEGCFKVERIVILARSCHQSLINKVKCHQVRRPCIEKILMKHKIRKSRNGTMGDELRISDKIMNGF